MDLGFISKKKIKFENFNDVPIEIYFIRHAHSCANMIEKFGGTGLKGFLTGDRSRLSNNPHITNFGISHSLNYSLTNKIKPDMICVSQLIRTWETAYSLFYPYFNSKKGCKPLYVCPYIGENRGLKNPLTDKYYDLDNEPESIEVSISKFNDFIDHYKKYVKKYYSKHFKSSKFCKPTINYLTKDLYNNKIISSKSKSSNFSLFNEECYTSKPNFGLFLSNILPKLLINIDMEKRDLKKPYRIVVVTHSHFMESNILGLLSENNLSKIKKYRNEKGKGKIKVYNCDTYKVSIPPHSSQISANIYFPLNNRYDIYKMPPYFDNLFNIEEKNTIPHYFKDMMECFRGKKCDELINICLGICNDKNNKYKKYIYEKMEKMGKKRFKLGLN